MLNAIFYIYQKPPKKIMNNFEKAKLRLRDALEQLEDVINAKFLTQDYNQKINTLEIENNDLRASLLMMKKEAAELKQKLKSLTIKQEQTTLISSMQQNVLDLNGIVPPRKSGKVANTFVEKENELSLAELKNVVGDNQ